MRNLRYQSLLLMAVAAAAIIIGAFARGDGGNAVAAPGDPGTATFTLTGGSAAQGATVDVPVTLSQFTPSVPSPNWGGYDLEVSYDPAVVHPTDDVIGVSNPCGAFWANTNASSPGHVVSGCAFQSSTFTGLLETITFTCQNVDAVSDITLVPVGDGASTASGTDLFDETSNPFDMTLVNATIACGSAVANTPTVTNTPAPTNTPTATNTAGPTNTPTSTPIPGTQTAEAALTATAAENFGGASTATPLPETQTAIAELTPAATDTAAAGADTATAVPPPPGGGNAGGGTTNPGGQPGGVITLPNTGSAGGGHAASGLWLIVAGMVLATFGGALFVKSLRLR